MSVSKFYDEIDGILDSMTEYLGIRDEDEDDYYDDIFGEDDDDDDDYIDDVICTRDDVDKCGIVLEKYIDELIELSKEPHDDLIMKAVEKAVRKLNKLNEACECELLDSTVGDDICDFIHNAAVEAGLSVIPENVCDDWREF